MRYIAGFTFVAATLCACSSPTPPSSTASPPAPTAIAPAECTKISEAYREHCGAKDNDVKAEVEQCSAQSRFAEAGGCLGQARRAYACTIDKVLVCGNAECCEKLTCAEPNKALENCLRGYCTSHGGNPDCVEFFGAPK